MFCLRGSKATQTSIKTVRSEPSETIDDILVVEHDFKRVGGWPNFTTLKLLITVSKTDSINRPTTDSNTFAVVGRRAIGLNSLFIEVGGWVLWTGTSSADFQIEGKYPPRREALNMVVNVALSRGGGAKSCRSQFVIPSGPGDFCSLIGTGVVLFQ